MQRRRFRTLAKWACTAAAPVTVGLAALSGLNPCIVYFTSSDGRLNARN